MIDAEYFDEGKVPPHSSDAEQALIGGLMLDKNAYAKIKSLVCVDDFYIEQHGFFFETISDLAEEGKPFDWIVISEHLKSIGKSEDHTSSYLGMLATNTPSAANILGYAGIVRDKSILRQLIASACKIQENAYGHDGKSGADLATEAQDDLIMLTQASRTVKSQRRTPKDMVRSIVDMWDKQKGSSEDILLGIPTSFEHLDQKTQGLEGGSLIILAGRPGMGKTAFAMALEQVNLAAGNSVAMLSLEMPESQLVQRHISFMSGVPLQKVKNSRLLDEQRENEWTKVTAAVKKFQNLPYYVDDTGGMSPRQIRDSVIAMNAQSLKDHGKPLSLIVVDYLQIMTADNKTSGDNRTNEVSQFSGELKRLAKDLNVPVVALSQLNRGLEQRPNKRPIASDLRDSGAIEQDADMIIFLYRDEIYNENDENKGQGEIIIGKNRNGEMGTVYAGFNGACTKWYDMGDQFNAGAY